MNRLIHLKTTTLSLLIASMLVCFALLPMTQAKDKPDGDLGNNNTAEGSGALSSLTTGTDNTAMGFNALTSLTTANFNTATGSLALSSNTGIWNTANGYNALGHSTTGGGNTAAGFNALGSNITGDSNTAVGANALQTNTGGLRNIALGGDAGFDITGDDNIAIGNAGLNGESGAIRIGESPPQTRTFIAAIYGVTTGHADALPVVIDSFGQLGTISSSERFKKEIKPMNEASETILALKPVTFHYKSDTKNVPQFGLIAEDVAKVNPDLVVRDRNGEIYTVRYDAVNAMLLNEFLKARRQIDAQQKQIEALTAGLQKVSVQLEVSKSAPQTVGNNQ